MKTEELKAIAHELGFWKGFVRSSRFLHGWVKDVRTPELHQTVYDFIRSVPNGKVMDVGSGVVSILNGSFPSTTHLLPVDPLGDLYGFIFDYEKHTMIQPVACPCEELTENGLKDFDIVHSSNSLDHMQDPVLAFENMLNATKKGGYAIVQCFENEAIYENYEGFHKWNLTLPDQLIRVENKEGDSAFLTGNFEVVKTEIVKFEDKNWFIWMAKKL